MTLHHLKQEKKKQLITLFQLLSSAGIAGIEVKPQQVGSGALTHPSVHFLV